MINAIIAGRRSLSVELALKIEKAMGYDEGFLAQLQTLFDIEKIKREWLKTQHKTAPNIRRIVFWDTDFDKIDWNRYRSFVIQRVLTRGSEDERREISRFYGIPLDRLAEHSLKEIPYSPKP
jgi:hypothetical protein